MLGPTIRSFLIATFTIGYAGAAFAPERCEIAISDVTEDLPGSLPASGIRIILVPGLDADWNYPTLRTFAERLAAAGHSLSLMSLPHVQGCFWTDGGKQYRAVFSSALSSVLARGPASRKTIIGGISYGGLHAMLGYASTTGLDGWFASLPVTRMDALAEYKTVGTVAAFDPSFETKKLDIPTALITWGTADDRVNYQLIRWLSQSLPAVSVIGYANGHHAITDEQTADMIAWIDRTFRATPDTTRVPKIAKD